MLQPMQVRLSDADREQYAITQEWLPFHPALFIERRASVLKEWEQQTGIKTLELLAGEVDIRSIELVKTIMWLACRVNDVTVPPFDEFDPQALAGQIEELELKPEGDDVDPPASSSTVPSVERKSRRPRAGSKS
jgi:hypothetical protein